MFLRFLLWWTFIKKFFFEALGKVFGGRTIKFYFLAIIKAIGHWYLIMVPPAIYVVYKLYEALKNAGILDALQTIVEKTLYSVVYIANNCFQKVLDLNSMLQCITSAPSDKTLSTSNYSHLSIQLVFSDVPSYSEFFNMVRIVSVL